MMNRFLRSMLTVNLIVISFLAFWVFIAPAAILIRELRDPGLRDGTIPRATFQRHAALSPGLAKWACERVRSGKAGRLRTSDVAATEWPMFSCVFFLWTAEALQESWIIDPSLAAVEPRRASGEAIEAAVDLITDPNHAAWVKAHWGARYLEEENLFYRMLLISGLTSYQKLTGRDRYQPLLATQVESLAKQIDRSPYGLLDDYPGQCYPIDVLPAIAAIRRADAVLGTDHSEFVARAERAFKGNKIDPQTNLPTYEVSSKGGKGEGPARGIGAANMLIWAPMLWPDTSRAWSSSFDEHFWRENWLLGGYREFSTVESGADWSIEVDAGPVIGGFGTAASAFGIGASRANGRLDRAYTLSTEAIAASWPLPDGTLIVPRLLSNVADAPYLGESILLFCLTRRPLAESNLINARGGVPVFVWLMFTFYLGSGILVVSLAIRSFRRWLRGGSRWSAPFIRFQFGLWSIVTLSAITSLILGHSIPGLLLFLLAQLFPRFASLKPEISPL